MLRTLFLWSLGLVLLCGFATTSPAGEPFVAVAALMAADPPAESSQQESPPADESEAPEADKPDSQPEPKPADNSESEEGKPDDAVPPKVQPEEQPKEEAPQESAPPDNKPEEGKPADDKPADDKPADESQKKEAADEKNADKSETKEPAKPEPRRVEWDDEVAKVFAKPAPENLNDLKIIQRQTQRVVQAATPATVAVRVGNAFGSAVIVSPDGLVLTAGHVVGQPNADVTFIFPDGKTAKGKTLGMNQQIDSGMMKITDPGPWPYVEIAKAGEIEGGQWVVAIGQPGGFDGERTPPVRLGRVLFANADVINTDCTLVGGDSGGPLFNMKGQVVGIHSRIGRRITNNYHVPISTYHQTWDRLAAAESWGSRLGGSEPVRSWPFLGIAGKRGADRCELTQVYPSRPAAIAGLKVGDVITRFDGKPVTSFEELGRLIAEQKPLSTVEVELKRGDEDLKLKVRLGITNRRIPGSFGENS